MLENVCIGDVVYYLGKEYIIFEGHAGDPACIHIHTNSKPHRVYCVNLFELEDSFDGWVGKVRREAGVVE